MPRATDNLVIGAMYYIEYQFDNQKYKRNAQLRFMHESDTHYFFDGRPLMGTQSLSKHFVSLIEPRLSDAKIFVDGRAPTK